MGKTNNDYESLFLQASDYTAVGGRKKNKTSRKYKGGMVSELSPAEFKGFAGCANWARGGSKTRKSRKLRKMSKRGGTIRKSHESVLTNTNVRYSDPLYGGRKRRQTRSKKSRRY